MKRKEFKNKKRRFKVQGFQTKFKHTKRRVYVTPEVYVKMRQIVLEYDDEISWIGAVRDIGNDLLCYDIIIPKQRCNGGTTEFEHTDILETMALEPDFDWGNFKLWGHSHVDFGVSPSGQDIDMMESFGKDLPEGFVSIIMNKQGAVNCFISDDKSIMKSKIEIYDTNGFDIKVLRSTIKDRVEKLTFNYHIDADVDDTKGYLSWLKNF